MTPHLGRQIRGSRALGGTCRVDQDVEIAKRVFGLVERPGGRRRITQVSRDDDNPVARAREFLQQGGARRIKVGLIP